MRFLRNMSQTVPQFPISWFPHPHLCRRQRWLGMLILLLAFGLEPVSGYAQESAVQSPQPNQDANAPVLIRGMQATGTIDVGYQQTAGFRGNSDYYRSIVNLGDGVRLLGANLDFQSPLGTKKYFDKLHLDASAWGGDPYNTFRIYAEKAGVYQFSFNYRKVDYYNFIPSFANPMLRSGVLLGQHSFDTAMRTMDFDLIFRPGRKVSPFLAYSRSSDFGPGITTFTGDGNEFAV